MAVNLVAFTSSDAANNDRPFGVYTDEATFVLMMDLVIAEFDRVNAIKDKTDADWNRWRTLKDTQFKMTAVHYKWTRTQAEVKFIEHVTNGPDQPGKIEEGLTPEPDLAAI
jgi:hypothetical protein